MPAPYLTSVTKALGALTGSNVTALPSMNVAAGKVLVLIGTQYSDTALQAIDGVSDTSTNTWESVGSTVWVANNRANAFICRSPAANASLVVSVNYNSGGGAITGDQWVLLQYDQAVAGSGGIADVWAITSAGGGGTSMTSAAFTTAQADELAVFGMAGATTFTAGSGWTKRAEMNYFGVQDQLFSAIQTAQTASMTCGGSAGPIVLLTLKLPGAVPGPGIATEADTALALASKQIRAAGMATETDTALALVTLAGLPFNTAPYEFGQRTGLDVDDFSIYASTSLNVSVYAATDVLLASQLFAYTESTGSDGRLTRKTHASLTAGTVYIFVAVTTGGALVAAGRITAT